MVYYLIDNRKYTTFTIRTHKIPHMNIYGHYRSVEYSKCNIYGIGETLCVHEDNAAFAALCGLDVYPITFEGMTEIVHNPLFEII